MPNRSEREIRPHANSPKAAHQEHPGDAKPDAVSFLQRTLGNRAVQRMFEAGADDLGHQIHSASGGIPLEGNVQRALEQQLGADLSGVRVHTDAGADRLARQVDATAFTSGADIFFRAGAYNPSTDAGRHTLAHEAVHVVQQASGPVAGSPVDGGIALSDPGDTFERAAEATAAALHFE
ncbi:MAG: DUF4157 domain-containing protein [Chloroflexi bacterium]|nr:DUF4157 domain-containing protein [Chloroflexota bacterium]MBV9134792.1 DUF4157 domain-containing protein [Chloroflexota bacterium]MBV9896832.1 DUF4157 domain-containing protein [Chloroflexota bacterium]